MPTKKTTTEELSAKQIGPFDILKLMFENQDEFWKIPTSTLAKNYFIINERMSIQYPLQAAVFNHTKINPGEVVKCWASFVSGKFNRTPGFIFIQGKKKAAETNMVKSRKFPEKFLQDFAWANGLSVKDVKFWLEANPLDAYQRLDEYDKSLKELEKIKSLSLASMKNKEETEEEPVLDGLQQEGMF